VLGSIDVVHIVSQSSPQGERGVFRFMMQIGMMVGFATSNPVNIFPVKSGWKEKMPHHKHETKRKMREEQSQHQQAA